MYSVTSTSCNYCDHLSYCVHSYLLDLCPVTIIVLKNLSYHSLLLSLFDSLYCLTVVQNIDYVVVFAENTRSAQFIASVVTPFFLPSFISPLKTWQFGYRPFYTPLSAAYPSPAHAPTHPLTLPVCLSSRFSLVQFLKSFTHLYIHKPINHVFVHHSFIHSLTLFCVNWRRYKSFSYKSLSPL